MTHKKIESLEEAVEFFTKHTLIKVEYVLKKDKRHYLTLHNKDDVVKYAEYENSMFGKVK